ncbi:hypothetical protein [Bacillus sp. FJAT-28004]|uniref:hypothetical protein n=1 Tax=Bacillus sp. FJAT-28004 TaxID=1679165 RepID=UPI0006B57EC0|nr:hypothetical protein [Bacillus sp. FJAT-28004]
MRNKVVLLTVSCICLFILMKANFVHACSPLPWKFEDAYESKAMVYGKVADSSEDGRKVTLDVISYAGPDQAPQTIYLPETIDNRSKYPAGNTCPDFSMKFKKGEEYVFFLADVPPNLKLYSPSWITASAVVDGEVVVGLPNGEKDSLQNHLQTFAQSKDYTIQSPNHSSPVWGKSDMLLLPSIIIVGLRMLLGRY